jgi:hypothetical protein
MAEAARPNYLSATVLDLVINSCSKEKGGIEQVMDDYFAPIEKDSQLDSAKEQFALKAEQLAKTGADLKDTQQIAQSLFNDYAQGHLSEIVKQKSYEAAFQSLKKKIESETGLEVVSEMLQVKLDTVCRSRIGLLHNSFAEVAIARALKLSPGQVALKTPAAPDEQKKVAAIKV